MTSIGSSPVREEIQDEVKNVLDKFVRIDELQAEASRTISQVTGAEAGCVTACAAAGISLGVASCITRTNIGKIRQLPNTEGLKDEVVVQKGHLVDFGAPVEQMIRIPGAKVVEIGIIDGSNTFELKDSIGEDTAATLFVESHHTTQYGNIPADDFIQISHEKNVPVIVDAAAEYNFNSYLDKGADLVTCSGHKFLQGLTSGLLAGKKKLIRACRLHQFGIGRTMKVGKEGIVSLIAALKTWDKRDLEKEKEETKKKSEQIVKRLEGTEGLETNCVKDVTLNPIIRVRLDVNPDKAIIDAYILSRELESSIPSIVTRSHHVEEGYLQLDTRFLNEKEIEFICKRIRNIMTKSKIKKEEIKRKHSPRESLKDKCWKSRMKWMEKGL